MVLIRTQSVSLLESSDDTSYILNGKVVRMEEQIIHILRKYEVTFALPGEVTICYIELIVIFLKGGN